MSLVKVSIGSVNGLLPVQNMPVHQQAIIWTNADLLSIARLGSNFSEVVSNYKIFIQEETIENIIWKVSRILFMQAGMPLNNWLIQSHKTSHIAVGPSYIWLFFNIIYVLISFRSIFQSLFFLVCFSFLLQDQKMRLHISNLWL